MWRFGSPSSALNSVTQAESCLRAAPVLEAHDGTVSKEWASDLTWKVVILAERVDILEPQVFSSEMEKEIDPSYPYSFVLGIK